MLSCYSDDMRKADYATRTNHSDLRFITEQQPRTASVSDHVS